MMCMKMIPFWIVCLLLGGISSFGQGKFMTTSGQTSFFSKTPAENISAVNKKGQAIITSSGEVAIRMNMKDFDFPNKLMEEHFNENYMESDQYPTATFSGKLDQVPDLTKNGSYEVTAQGKFTIHGVTQNRTFKGKLDVKEGKVGLNAEFSVALTDHKIEVPKIVFVKIAQVIKVTIDFTLLAK
jgi:polyisoprenoid-binding protein YceI